MSIHLVKLYPSLALAVAITLAAGDGQARPMRRPVGVVRGTVQFRGTPPVRAPLRRDSDPVCARIEKLAEDVVVTGGKLRDVHVRIKPGTLASSFAGSFTPAEITQTECMYTPRVVGVMIGEGVMIRNGDPTYHNVHGSVGTRTLWNLSQPAAAPEIMRTDLGKAGDVVSLRCDVHAWMQAYVVITDHPFFDVTEADGVFELRGVPPGTYELEAWHPTLGLRTTRITVGKGKAVPPVTFTFGP